MPKYNVIEVVAETKRSEFIYKLNNGTEKVVAPSGKGAPKAKIPFPEGFGTLDRIIRYAPVSVPRKTKEAKEVLPKVDPLRTTVTGPVAGIQLVYSDGNILAPTGGRPKHRLDSGATLVEIRTVVLGAAKKTKGRAPVERVEEEVTSGAGIFYVYGTTEYPRGSVVPGKGAPPQIFKGETLVKIIKRVLSASAPAPEAPTEPVIIPLWEKGWVAGQKVRYIGSAVVGEVVAVREEYLSVVFPGDKFINPIRPGGKRKIERV